MLEQIKKVENNLENLPFKNQNNKNKYFSVAFSGK